MKPPQKKKETTEDLLKRLGVSGLHPKSKAFKMAKSEEDAQRRREEAERVKKEQKKKKKQRKRREEAEAAAESAERRRQREEAQAKKQMHCRMLEKVNGRKNFGTSQRLAWGADGKLSPY